MTHRIIPPPPQICMFRAAHVAMICVFEERPQVFSNSPPPPPPPHLSKYSQGWIVLEVHFLVVILGGKCLIIAPHIWTQISATAVITARKWGKSGHGSKWWWKLKYCHWIAPSHVFVVYHRTPRSNSCSRMERFLTNADLPAVFLASSVGVDSEWNQSLCWTESIGEINQPPKSVDSNNYSGNDGLRSAADVHGYKQAASVQHVLEQMGHTTQCHLSSNHVSQPISGNPEFRPSGQQRRSSKK